MKKEKHVLLGAHMSVAGGFEKAFARAEAIDANCMQIFTKSNRQWHAKPLDPAECALFKKVAATSSVNPVIVHASYLINIGSTDAALRKKSIDALSIELERCKELGIHYLVLHPGSSTNGTKQDCIKNIAESLATVFDTVPGSTMILLENTAGQGSAVGNTFEELKEIYQLVHDKKRVGFCLDTCHAFAAGYDFRTPATYEAMIEKIEKTIGLNHIKAIHLNDSKKGLGSHVDRHEDIGKGMLGLEAFSLLMNDKRFADVPKILETPKEGESDQPYAENIKILKKLLK